MFSSRTAFDRSLNALASALAGERARGKEVLDLTASNPTTAGIPYARDAIQHALGGPGALTYEPAPFGLPFARAAVAKLHAVDPERVVLTASTSEAYAFLFKLLCDPGDEIAVPQPSYPLFDHLAAFEAVRLAPYHLAYDGAWHLDLSSLRRAVGPRTRAILVVSPNNPTGSYLKEGELASLASFGLPIISDEVFAPYALGEDPTRARTALQASGVLVFVLAGLSKLAALPQMKLAWIVAGGPDALVRDALERLELIADAFLSVGAPVQHALPALLESRHLAEEAIVRRTRRNHAHLQELVGADSPATCLRAEGGWYATLRVPTTQSEEAWAVELVQRDGVYVHTGAFFGFPHEAHLILSLLTPEAIFDEGVTKLLHRVKVNAS